MNHLAAAAVAAVLGAGACRTPAPAERPNLYACEGCDAVFEHPTATALTPEMRLAPPGEPGEAFVLEGTTWQTDGRTPAAGVVLYAYHTNAAGRYVAESTATGWGRRHGALRGWLRTGTDGRFRITTIRPGPYPSGDLPAHIHLTLQEPGRRPYYLDDVVFTDDPLVDAAYRRAAENRGGSGLVTPTRDADGTWHAERPIFLEP